MVVESTGSVLSLLKAQKVQETFDDRDDEPIMHAGKAAKWARGEVSDCEIYPYWE